LPVYIYNNNYVYTPVILLAPLAPALQGTSLRHPKTGIDETEFKVRPNPFEILPRHKETFINLSLRA
jgi:hypothetical protein